MKNGNATRLKRKQQETASKLKLNATKLPAVLKLVKHR